MLTHQIEPPCGSEPELNLLMAKSDFDEPLWKSLVQKFNDRFFPKKATASGPNLETHPCQRHLGFYDYKKMVHWVRPLVHILAVIVIIGGTCWDGAWSNKSRSLPRL